ncbi:MAG: hypothetical protein ABH824_03925 [Nanoarchaeota archaeon]|nr:hypothetical protein [Nanoarchaeota archaeon]MBU1632566.1 hypothetical protein [Nanoarchaeota archaeon]MBU1876585.1 hypothetical protein [Nanoarchaeota archaeon]
MVIFNDKKFNKKATSRFRLSFWESKKGMTPWQVITALLISVVVVILVLMFFRRSGEKGFGFAEDKITGLSTDLDGDGVPDAVDKCVGAKDEQTKDKMENQNKKIDSSGCPVNKPELT